jgi:CHASE2 domain
VTSTTPAAKFGELLVLGVIIGLVSMGASFLWKEYKYKTSDFLQYLTADVLHSHPLRIPFVIIDIGDDTCKQWTGNDYGGECSFLPILPHSKLERIFSRMFPEAIDFRIKPKPKLVVVDLDLRPEQPEVDPFKPKVEQFNEAEKAIRSIVEHQMDGVPLLVAQRLIRIPQEGEKQHYNYVAVDTILHQLAEPKRNLRFGQVEQDLGDDSVLRRFPATIQLLRPDTLDPDPTGINRKEHLALKVCELVRDPDPNLCRRSPDITSGFVEFRYRLARNADRLLDSNVKVIEARSVLADSFDVSVLDKAVVIIGSTARGRGDYHFTPLDVWDRGETAGVIVLANEVAAALENEWMHETQWGWELLEKGILVLVSTTLMVLAFWVPWLHWHLPPSRTWRLKFSFGILFVVHFMFVMVGIILVNLILDGFIFFKLFNLGEIVDPVTPVIAAVLDLIVDISTVIGHRVGSRLDPWVGRFWSAFS